MRLYGLKNCDTCRKAMKALEAAGVDFTFHDVRADGVTSDDLARWAANADWKKLVNNRSTTWRGLSDAEKESANEEAGALALLEQHPTLIKRPVIENGDAVTIGWTKDVEAALVGG